MSDKKEETLEKSAAEAMAELDQLEKALGGDEAKEETDLDNLEKAIDEAEEALSKSDDEDEDDQSEDGEEEDEDLEKSEDDSELAEELIKASEAYAELEGSVEKLDGAVEKLGAKVETLTKSVQLLVGLNTRQAKVIASLTKSLQQQGERPLKKSGAQIGVGGDRETPMAKSKSELREILEKALPSGKVPRDILSFLDAYGVEAAVKRLPEATQTELGLK